MRRIYHHENDFSFREIYTRTRLNIKHKKQTIVALYQEYRTRDNHNKEPQPELLLYESNYSNNMNEPEHIFFDADNSNDGTDAPQVRTLPGKAPH